MLPAWVMGFADGTETGTYLALDLGGTNLRVCNVVLLKEGRKYDMIQSKYRLVCDCSTIRFLTLARCSTDWDWRRTIRLHCRLFGQFLERQQGYHA